MFCLLNILAASLFFSLQEYWTALFFPWHSEAGKEVNYDSWEIFFLLYWKIINMLPNILGLKLWDQACKMITLAFLIKILISLHFRRRGNGGLYWFQLSGMLGKSIVLIKTLYFRVERGVLTSSLLVSVYLTIVVFPSYSMFIGHKSVDYC